MKNKKILFVGPNKSIHVRKWLDYFREAGYYCGFATFGSNVEIEADEVFILSDIPTNVYGKNYYYLYTIPKLANIIQTFSPSFLIAHFSYSMGLISMLALRIISLKRRQNKTLIFSVVCHGSDILTPPYPRLTKLINYWVLRSADLIFSVSNQIKETIKEMGIHEKRIVNGLYGLDEKLFLPPRKKDIDLLSFRSLVPNSKIEWLLARMEEINLENYNCYFVLPNATSNQLNELILKYPHIKFLPALRHDELIELVARSRVYLSATLSDGTPLSLLEAMANGCYPVVSNIPANREWIVNGINGKLFDTAVEFHDAVRSALSLDNDILWQIRKMNINMLRERALYKTRMGQILDHLENNVGRDGLTE